MKVKRKLKLFDFFRFLLSHFEEKHLNNEHAKYPIVLLLKCVGTGDTSIYVNFRKYPIQMQKRSEIFKNQNNAPDDQRDLFRPQPVLPRHDFEVQK